LSDNRVVVKVRKGLSALLQATGFGVSLQAKVDGPSEYIHEESGCTHPAAQASGEVASEKIKVAG
jgi:hypothetical protein